MECSSFFPSAFKAVVAIFAALWLTGCVDQQQIKSEPQFPVSFWNGSYRIPERMGFSYGYNLDTYESLIATEQWMELAELLADSAMPEDLSYFYLGLAAENLGYRDAALIYYRISKRMLEGGVDTLQCNGMLGDCNGRNLRSELSTRLSSLSQVPPMQQINGGGVSTSLPPRMPATATVLQPARASGHEGVYLITPTNELARYWSEQYFSKIRQASLSALNACDGTYFAVRAAEPELEIEHIDRIENGKVQVGESVSENPAYRIARMKLQDAERKMEELEEQDVPARDAASAIGMGIALGLKRRSQRKEVEKARSELLSTPKVLSEPQYQYYQYQVRDVSLRKSQMIEVYEINCDKNQVLLHVLRKAESKEFFLELDRDASDPAFDSNRDSRVKAEMKEWSKVGVPVEESDLLSLVDQSGARVYRKSIDNLRAVVQRIYR